jgi:hypothetical protein
VGLKKQLSGSTTDFAVDRSAPKYQNAPIDLPGFFGPVITKKSLIAETESRRPFAQITQPN